ncbi:MAG: hypothetical protein DMF98_23395, partial [Acidobacteria bacterium]
MPYGAVLLFAAAAATQGQSRAPARTADLVLRGGKIVTVDDDRPLAEALAVVGDTIAAVGSNQEIQPQVGPNTRVIDLQGALAIPGFIDAHAHFTGVGEAARNLQLSTAKDWDDIVYVGGAKGSRTRSSLMSYQRPPDFYPLRTTLKSSRSAEGRCGRGSRSI